MFSIRAQLIITINLNIHDGLIIPFIRPRTIATFILQTNFFLHVEEIFTRLARTSSLQIFHAANQSLLYGGYNTMNMDKARLQT